MEKKRNFERIKRYYEEKLDKVKNEGVFGVALFNRVYEELIPSQKSRLKEICGERFDHYREEGSIICIGLTLPREIIECINIKEDGKTDRDRWNIYAKEYQKINKLLNTIARDIAIHLGGIPIPATLEEGKLFIGDVSHVKEYDRITVSHRVVAEKAGIGWRGKNELILNEKYGCAMRFASIITDLPLIQGEEVECLCGDCRACLDACPFLRDKEATEDYRENCRRFIIDIDLDSAVCGKCIAACYHYRRP